MKSVNPSRVLFIRWKSIGDIVQTLPAWKALRAAFPEAHISYMTSAENQGVVKLFPGVDEVLALERRALFLLKRGPGKLTASWRTIWKATLGGKFDLVVDMQSYGETALLTFLSAARSRWGLLYKNARSYAYTAPVACSMHGHRTDAYLEVLRQNGISGAAPNRLHVPEPVLQAGRELLARMGIRDTRRPIVCIHPLTSTPHKNWSLEGYAKLARHAERQGFQVVVSGGPSDKEQLQQSPLSTWSLACGQDLATSCGLVSLAGIVLGGDTGLTHLAHAAGSRVVMIMRSSALGRSGPYQHPDRAVTGSQLADIGADEVISAFDLACCEKREPMNEIAVNLASSRLPSI